MTEAKSTETSSQKKTAQSSQAVYEIKVQGHLDQLWAHWFEGMTLSHIENGESGEPYTLITGPVIDQPALHGLLMKIRDLNLILVSVRRIVPQTNISEEIDVDSFQSGKENKR